jgi:molybdenum cofactor cytidylyltransferase
VIAAVIIASGFSRRMGRSKLDLELGGRTFLQRAIGAATGARGIGRCLVVVRPEDQFRVKGSEFQVAGPSLRADSKLETRNSKPRPEVVLNPSAAEGQSASIRLAVERLSADPAVDAAIFSVVDQPFLTPAVFEVLIEAWQSDRDGVFVSSYTGQRGNPALFPRAYFRELAALTGDVGGRDVIRRHPDAVHEVPMLEPAAGRDVDTWEEYLEAQRLLS